TEKIAKITRAIEFNLREVGCTSQDQEESARLVRQLRSERDELATRLKQLEAVPDRQIRIPTEVELQELLSRLDEILTNLASVNHPERAGKLREVIELMTGGRIELVQCGERRKHGGWLQGRLKIHLLAGLSALSNDLPATDHGPPLEVVIDYKPEKPWEAEADAVKGLADEGLLNCEIGKRLGFSPAKVSKLWRLWHEARGLAIPCGHMRRKA